MTLTELGAFSGRRATVVVTMCLILWASTNASALSPEDDPELDEDRPTQSAAEKSVPASDPPLLPASHAGSWAGQNRLWVIDPTNPFRSTGTIAVSGDRVRYTWSHEGEDQTGVLQLAGQRAALQGDWVDSWHASEGMVLHGYIHEGVVRLYGIYPVESMPPWGWQIELDTRDPEALVMRMFNVVPGVGVVPAVFFFAERER